MCMGCYKTVFFCSLLVFCLTSGTGAAGGLEQLSAVQLYKVENSEAAIAQPLPEPSPFFDNWDSTPSSAPLSPAWAPPAELAWSSPSKGKYPMGRARHRQVQWQTRSMEVPRYSDWELGTNNWRYQDPEGFSLTLGGSTASSPSWARDVRLSGVSVAQDYTEQENLPAWSYSVSVGAMALNSDIEQGDLQYGATAASMSASVSPLSNVSVDSLLQSSSGLAVMGLGGRYHSDYFGEWQASVARASHTYGQGWRYQAAYDLEVWEQTRVRWNVEQYESRFADLSRYQSLASQRGGARQTWELRTALPHVGQLGTAYEVARNELGVKDRYVGLSQQFWYSPNLRVRLQARKHLDGDKSNVGLYFSLPIF